MCRRPGRRRPRRAAHRPRAPHRRADGQPPVRRAPGRHRRLVRHRAGPPVPGGRRRLGGARAGPAVDGHLPCRHPRGAAGHPDRADAVRRARRPAQPGRGPGRTARPGVPVRGGRGRARPGDRRVAGGRRRGLRRGAVHARPAGARPAAGPPRRRARRRRPHLGAGPGPGGALARQGLAGARRRLRQRVPGADLRGRRRQPPRRRRAGARRPLRPGAGRRAPRRPAGRGPASCSPSCRRRWASPRPRTAWDVRRWSLAKPLASRDEPYHLGAAGIGLAGDGWHGPSRVEAAYLSGLALGEALAARLTR